MGQPASCLIFWLLLVCVAGKKHTQKADQCTVRLFLYKHGLQYSHHRHSETSQLEEEIDSLTDLVKLAPRHKKRLLN